MCPLWRRRVARGLGAALFLSVAPARGQAPPAGADPSPPSLPDLAPLPELGVDWPDPARIDATAAPAGAAVASAPVDQVTRYRVVLDGAEVLGPTFRLRFDQLSALVTDESKPANAAQLHRRQSQDEGLARDLMRAQGYYDGTVGGRIEPATATGPTVVHLKLEPGTRYRFKDVALPGVDKAGSVGARLRRGFAIKRDDAVDADAVIAAVAALKADLGRGGFPFAKVGDPQVTVDHKAHTASLALAVEAGAPARFGRIRLEGSRPLFSAAHVATIARFHPGQPFDAQRLDDLRRALIATGLVSTATVSAVATNDPGIVDVSVRIDRAPPRTVAAELGYGTGQGARVALSWEHRNLLAPEGAVTFRGVGGTREQSLGATLRRGNFEARDRVLTAQIVASHSTYDAYDARTFTIGGSVERQTNIIWQKKWVWSAGAEFVATNERDKAIDTALNQRRTFLVAAAPGSLAYDGTDDLLNPTRGYRLAGRISPEVSLHDGVTLYAKAQVDASAYLPWGDHLVFAGRIRLATIEGAARNDVAPSRRLYSGGGGSIRGFGYQKVGPEAVDGTPVGGRGLTEFGTEARVRFGNFGVVPFLDWGTLTTSSTPSFSGFRFGTGMGVRYYSSFGPIRLDVGTPVNRHNGDSRVAIYVSLGQAF